MSTPSESSGPTVRLRDVPVRLWRARIGVLAVVATVAVGCSVKPDQIGTEPSMSPVGAGIEQKPVAPATYDSMNRAAYLKPVGHNSSSLWTPRGADLFRDRRARRTGDILTVTISMKDKAIMDNRSKRSRDSAHGFGLDWSHGIDTFGLKSEGKAAVNSGLKSNTATDGKGEIERSENIDLRLAAVVTEVLPNGNLLIQGSQEVRVNFELRVLTFTGVVNITDIRSDNTIPYERIAEARISYGGRGRSMEVQQPAWGQQLLDKYSPF
ncbi:flagellar basal body L-ring protein FlgH [Hyphomicrobium sp. CS1BSMeth3]|uniref:flagellar basal body L-ring protein FlgH n=1 Tax=Hyphomicrobium sp. CS1BSMeth3 TaxID=1892844 RepID=UPI001FCD6B21|nr:flagellar basal body L-ring protein FlgH [Hyphomicrobium sp. CS1BSMeth3]